MNESTVSALCRQTWPLRPAMFVCIENTGAPRWSPPQEPQRKGNYIRSYPAGRVRLVRFDAVLDGKVGCLVHVSRYRLYGVA